MKLQHPAFARSCGGFSYAEVLLSVVLLGVLLVPALQALGSAVTGTPSGALASGQLTLQSRMEEILAAPFSRLYSETYVAGANTKTSVSTAFSDPAGAVQRRIAVVYRYDASAKNLSAADTGLVLVSVYYESEGPAAAFSTLKGRWW